MSAEITAGAVRNVLEVLRTPGRELTAGRKLLPILCSHVTSPSDDLLAEIIQAALSQQVQAIRRYCGVDLVVSEDKDEALVALNRQPSRELPERRQWEATWAYYICGLATEQIGAALGCGNANVYALRMGGIERLVKALQPGAERKKPPGHPPTDGAKPPPAARPAVRPRPRSQGQPRLAVRPPSSMVNQGNIFDRSTVHYVETLIVNPTPAASTPAPTPRAPKPKRDYSELRNFLIFTVVTLTTANMLILYAAQPITALLFAIAAQRIYRHGRTLAQHWRAWHEQPEDRAWQLLRMLCWVGFASLSALMFVQLRGALVAPALNIDRLSWAVMLMSVAVGMMMWGTVDIILWVQAEEITRWPWYQLERRFPNIWPVRWWFLGLVVAILVCAVGMFVGPMLRIN